MRFLRLMLLAVLMQFAIFSTAKAQDIPEARDYFAEAVVDNTNPYIGQQIIYQFRFYDAVETPDPLYEAPGFEGFWRLDNQTIRQEIQQLNGRQYTVTEVKTALYPTQIGAITISPAQVLFPETVYRAQEVISANSVVIDVKPLPGSAPEGFTGAVGQFDLSATLDRQSALLGETFTLRLTVTGTGNVEQLTLPDPPESGTLEIYSSSVDFTVNEGNGLFIGEKVYEYVLLPRQAGVEVIPRFTLHYFDPVIMSYRSINTQLVPLEILPTNETTPVQTLAITDLPSQSLDATLLPIMDIALAQQQPSRWGYIALLLVWLVPPVGLGSIWWWVRRQKSIQQQQHILRKAMALSRAQSRLRRSSKLPAVEMQLRVRDAIVNYFADKLDCSPASMTDSDLQVALTKINAPSSLRKQVMLCLERSDEARYGPLRTVEPLALINQTLETLSALDEVWHSE